MSTFERLMRLAEAGDLGAAEQLLREAERRSDWDAEAIARQGQADIDGLVACAAKGIEAGRWALVQRVTTWLGFELTEASGALLVERLAQENHRLQVKLPLADVLHALHRACVSSAGYAWKGTRRINRYGSSNNVFCFAVVASKELVVDIKRAVTNHEPFPGQAWREMLLPWERDAAANTERAQAWARRDGRIRLPLEPLPEHLTQRAGIEEQLSRMRKLLQDTRRKSSWLALHKLFEGWTGPGLEAAVEEAREHVCARWKPQERYAYPEWWDALVTESSAPHLALVEHAASPLSNAIVARMGKGLPSGVKSLERWRFTARSKRQEPYEAAVRQIAASPHLTRLFELDLAQAISADAFTAVMAPQGDVMSALRKLTVRLKHNSPLEASHTKRFTRTTVEHLTLLDAAASSADAFHALESWDARLKSLTLSGAITEESARVLFALPCLEELRSLTLKSSETVDFFRVLAETLT